MYRPNLSDFARAETVVVPDIGQIGAGTTVDFLPARQKRRIRRPHGARQADHIVSARVSGDSLAGDFIFDGDRVAVRLNFEMSEVRQGRLVVVRLPCGALALKHFYLTGDGRVRLESRNPAYEDMHFELGEVEVKALVIESVRTWD
jgi:SOS-response transcriptional repressor LexA